MIFRCRPAAYRVRCHSAFIRRPPVISATRRRRAAAASSSVLTELPADSQKARDETVSHCAASTRASTRRLAGRSLEAAGRQRARRGRERRRRPAGAQLPWGHRRAAACRRPSHALCWGHCAAGRRRCPRPVPRRFQKRLNRESISVLDEPPSPPNAFLRFSLF